MSGEKDLPEETLDEKIRRLTRSIISRQDELNTLNNSAQDKFERAVIEEYLKKKLESEKLELSSYKTQKATDLNVVAASSAASLAAVAIAIMGENLHKKTCEILSEKFREGDQIDEKEYYEALKEAFTKLQSTTIDKKQSAPIDKKQLALRLNNIAAVVFTCAAAYITDSLEDQYRYGENTKAALTFGAKLTGAIAMNHALSVTLENLWDFAINVKDRHWSEWLGACSSLANLYWFIPTPLPAPQQQPAANAAEGGKRSAKYT